MECGVSVRLARFPVIVVLTLIAQVSWAELAVVLVADSDSPVESISMLDIRKIYLGISVAVDGVKVRGIRWRNDERLDQIFLQSVIAMSQRSYERRLLSMVLKYGTPRPAVANDRDELMELLAINPSSIAYMWKVDAEADSRVKIIRVLWQES